MTLRKLLFWLHLVTGLTVGLVIAFLAITGFIMTFQPQILNWAERGSRIASSSEQGCVAPSILLKNAAAFRQAAPTSLALYSDPHEPTEVSFGETAVVLVDGCSGKVIGPGANRLRTFFQATRDLHRWVALNGVRHESLRAIKNIAVCGFLFLILSGLVIWFPRKLTWKHLRPTVLFRGNLRGRAREWNWHNVFGFWMSLPLAAISLSGLIMAYPWANALLYRAAGDPPPPVRTELAPKRPKPLAVDKTPSLDLAIQKAILQDSKWKSLSLRLPAAKDPNVTFTLDESDGGKPQQRAQLVIARKNGQVVRWEPFTANLRGRRWRLYARFLHTGEMFGLIGRFVALMAMVSALMLVWTGVALFLRRLASWRKRREAHGKVAQSPPRAAVETARF